MIQARILQWEVGNRIEERGLNCFQVLVCRLFKIPVPEIKFWVQASIIANKFLQPHDKIVVPGLGIWNVIEKKRGADIFVISSEKPIAEHSPQYEGFVTILREGYSDDI